MTTISFYNGTRKRFANGEIDLSSLKVMLRNAITLFDPSHNTIGDLAGAEVSGNGWVAGGVAIANAAITTIDGAEAKLDGDDISVQAVGGTIGPASSAVVYVAGGVQYVLFFIDFGGVVQAVSGDNFNVEWDVLGIARWLS